jgi:hypothetical protein
VLTVPVTGVTFCTPPLLTAYTLNVYDVLAVKPAYACDVAFAPETLVPLAGMPLAVVGLYVITTELYVPLHDTVVSTAVVASVSGDVITPGV